MVFVCAERMQRRCARRRRGSQAGSARPATAVNGSSRRGRSLLAARPACPGAEAAGLGSPGRHATTVRCGRRPRSFRTDWNFLPRADPHPTMGGSPATAFSRTATGGAAGRWTGRPGELPVPGAAALGDWHGKPLLRPGEHGVHGHGGGHRRHARLAPGEPEVRPFDGELPVQLHLVVTGARGLGPNGSGVAEALSAARERRGGGEAGVVPLGRLTVLAPPLPSQQAVQRDVGEAVAVVSLLPLDALEHETAVFR